MRQFVVTSVGIAEPEQREPGWTCPECNLVRGPDQCGPCIGKLPGVVFACCGHGGLTKPYSMDGYIYFENGVVVRFEKLTKVERVTPGELAEAIWIKERLGQ